MADEAERNIPLVLITGAGASTDLGVQGNKLPLMDGWCREVKNALIGLGGQHLDITGLRDITEGQDFETQLGAYLRSRLAFTQIERLVDVTQYNTVGGNSLQMFDRLRPWYDDVSLRLREIDDALNKTLIDLYGTPAVDERKGAKAYEALLRDLDVGRSTRWVYATTNYDPVAELSLQELDYIVNWGENVRARPSSRPLQVDTLLQGVDVFVPILHLHGRAGWYERDGVPYATDAPYNPGFGTPLVMLPDPDKDYSLAVIDQIWSQFEIALDRAQMVLVIGHRLHDKALVKALRERVTPARRIGVALYADPTENALQVNENDPTLEIVRSQLPGAKEIPMRFGDPETQNSEALRDWLEHVRVGAGRYSEPR